MAGKSKVTFTDKDNGWRELMTRWALNTGDLTVVVGFLRSSAFHKKKHEKDKPITVARIAAIHEFGSLDGTIPERSFMRSSIDENLVKLTKLLKKLSGLVIDGRMQKKQALGLVGQNIADAMKAKIRTGRFEPLAESTIKAKGSSKPLIDTGQMINSIEFDFRKGKQKGEND